MKRIKDEFVDTLDRLLPLAGRHVLEIGCGDGSRSAQIAARCASLTGLEPDAKLVNCAQARRIGNAVFKAGRAERLPYPDRRFGISIFPLSLHHVPVPLMHEALSEAARVTESDGLVVVLEPTERGSFFEAELHFDACDGDERAAKQAVRAELCVHPRLEPVAWWEDEVVFTFDSPSDFRSAMAPKKNIGLVYPFLQKHHFTLRAVRRIDVYRPKV